MNAEVTLGTFVVAAFDNDRWFLATCDQGLRIFHTREAAQAYVDGEIAYFIGYYKILEAGQAAYKILHLEEV